MSPMLLVSLPPGTIGRASEPHAHDAPHGERGERRVMHWAAIAVVAALPVALLLMA